MAIPHLIDPVSGQRLMLIVRRILAPGVHTAAGFGASFYAPEGTTRKTLSETSLIRWRFFVTPFKAFPVMRDGFAMPALRCDGRGLTVIAPGATPPRPDAQRLGDLARAVPIPWPEGSVGNPGPDYIAPRDRKRAEKARKQGDS